MSKLRQLAGQALFHAALIVSLLGAAAIFATALVLPVVVLVLVIAREILWVAVAFLAVVGAILGFGVVTGVWISDKKELGIGKPQH